MRRKCLYPRVLTHDSHVVFCIKNGFTIVFPSMNYYKD